MKNDDTLRIKQEAEAALYTHVKDWAAQQYYKFRRFPRWDFEDLHHEAYIIAKEKYLPKWDPERCSFLSYLYKVWFLDLVYARYTKANADLVMSRKQGKGKRILVKLCNVLSYTEQLDGLFHKECRKQQTKESLEDALQVLKDEWGAVYHIGHGKPLYVTAELLGYKRTAFTRKFSVLKEKIKSEAMH